MSKFSDMCICDDMRSTHTPDGYSCLRQGCPCTGFWQAPTEPLKPRETYESLKSQLQTAVAQNEKLTADRDVAVKALEVLVEAVEDTIPEELISRDIEKAYICGRQLIDRLAAIEEDKQFSE